MILALICGKLDVGLPRGHLQRRAVGHGELEDVVDGAFGPGARDVLAAVEVVERAGGIDDVVDRLDLTLAGVDLRVVLLGPDDQDVVRSDPLAVGQDVRPPGHAALVLAALGVVDVAHVVGVGLLPRHSDAVRGLAFRRTDLGRCRRPGQIVLLRSAAELRGLLGQHLRVADDRAVVVGHALVGAHAGRVDRVRAGALGGDVGVRDVDVLPVVLGVVDHPRLAAGVADDHTDRAQHRDVHGPHRPDWRHVSCRVRVEDRHQSGAGIAVRVAVAVELDVDDVGQVQPRLRVLVLVVRDLDRGGGMLGVGRVREQPPGQRPARARVDTRGGARGGARGRRGRRAALFGEPLWQAARAAVPATPSAPSKSVRRLTESFTCAVLPAAWPHSRPAGRH